uniref:Uncharacterized protein n=1 Tax=Heterosigma akashiwo TaxID=2829 RepID=A0A7S3UXV6_HETAK
MFTRLFSPQKWCLQKDARSFNTSRLVSLIGKATSSNSLPSSKLVGPTSSLPTSTSFQAHRCVHLSRRCNFQDGPFPKKNPLQDAQGFAGSKVEETLPKAGRTAEIISNLKHAEEYLMKRIHIGNQNRFRTAVLGTILTCCWLTATFGQEIYSFFTKQTAEVAKETLRQESLQIQTQELATAIVQTLLNDDQVMKNATIFLKEAAGNEETKKALVGLGLFILQHEETMREAVELGRKIVVQLSKEPSVINNIALLMLEVLKDKRVQESASDLVADLSENEQVYEAVVQLTNRVLSDPTVSDQVTTLLSEASISVLSDDTVISHSKEFISEVANDEEIQKAGSKALWHTVKYSVQPHLKRIVGAALVGTSIALFAVLQSQ